MTEDIIRQLGHLTLGSRLKRLGERLQADVQRLALSEGIEVPTAHFAVLTALRRNGALTVGELADALGVAQPGVTRSLAQIQKLGLVTSARGKSDQRQRRVSLTAKGEALVDATYQDVWPRVQQAVEALCAGLDGPLLNQLEQMERELARLPLDRRAAKSAQGDGT